MARTRHVRAIEMCAYATARVADGRQKKTQGARGQKLGRPIAKTPSEPPSTMTQFPQAVSRSNGRSQSPTKAPGQGFLCALS
jgi:hypothetical protein